MLVTHHIILLPITNNASNYYYLGTKTSHIYKKQWILYYILSLFSYATKVDASSYDYHWSFGVDKPEPHQCMRQLHWQITFKNNYRKL